MEEQHRKTIVHYEVHQQPRFLTCSCFHRLALFQNDSIKNAFVERIDMARKETRFKLHGWVIMPEHVHLLIVPALPQFDLPQVLKALKPAFAREVVGRWRGLKARILPRLKNSKGHHFWQRGPGYDRNIRTEQEYYDKLDYIHENPVKRGLVQRAIDWPWSSARWYAGLDDALLEIDAW